LSEVAVMSGCVITEEVLLGDTDENEEAGHTEENENDGIVSKSDSEDSDYLESESDEEAEEDSIASLEEITLEKGKNILVEDIYSTFGDRKILSTQSNKIGIAFFYCNVLRAPGEETWSGNDGVINKILDSFKIRNKGYYRQIRRGTNSRKIDGKWIRTPIY